MEKFHEVTMEPENFLKDYVPEGAKISRKSVSHAEIQFYATISILLIAKTFFRKV